MKKLLAFLVALLVAASALAQSSPGLQYGAIPTAGQWNSYFAAKVDYNVNGIPITSGGTGATSAAGALRNIFGAPATSGYYMRGNGSIWSAGAIQAADVPTLNQNTTGYAAGLAGGAIGSVPYQSAANTTLFLTGNTGTTAQFYTSTGTGSAAQAPTLTSSTGTGSVVLATGATITNAAVSATTLSASSTVSGAGFVALQASPNPMGSTTPNTGAFTTLSATSTVSGAGFTAFQAAPNPIGSTTPNTGAFTTLSASSTVSGTGFSTYLASPPAIGGTAANTVKGTVVTATTSVNLTNLLVSATAPTLGSCGGGSPTISAPNGTAAFRVTLGAAINACTINLPTATTGWNCFGQDVTATANAWQLKQTANTTTSVTLSNYSAGSLTNMNSSDVVAVSCFAY